RSQHQEVLQVQLVLDILYELGTSINADSQILDFGCGEGKLVHQFRKRGLSAFGVDIENHYGHVQSICREEGIAKADEEVFHSMEMDTFKIPFEDNTFDLVVSFYVFEHVQNWSESLAEIKRVLKAGGTSLHIFPSRYCPIEPHVFVPLASIIRSYGYLAFWARLGIRNSYQKDLSWKEVARLNFEYLRTCTTYFPRSEIRKQVVTQFGNVSFVEGIFIKHHFGRVTRYLSVISRKFPFISQLFSTFFTRVIFFKKDDTEVFMNGEIIKLQSFVDRLLSEREAIKVLEAGCGNHSNIKIPKNTPCYIVGIDISEEELQMNSAVNEKIVGDIQSYVLPSSEFDVIVCWWVLEHVSHPEKALDNFLRSMKEDGILILAVPNVFSIKGLLTKYTPHWFHIWVHRSFWKFLSAEGFTPFRTYLKFSISPASIRRYAAKNGLSIEYSSLYESQTVREFREKHKIVNMGWWLSIQIIKALSFGKIDVGPTEFLIVLKKKKVSATESEVTPSTALFPPNCF
ncbi:MAG: methyltransferase domain-containing protein, partial [Ktedonobacteraceae bacterium]